MLLPRFFGREKVRSTRRPVPRRRPLVEALEGRQLLSTFNATDVVQRKHILSDGSHGDALQANSIEGNVIDV